MPDVSDPREPLLRFGPFEVNAAEMELRKHGIRIKLAARPFRVLLLLLARPGQVVQREEIRKELWGDDTFVDFDRNLNLCISQVRAALSDDASAPAYIETIPRLGYRFTGELLAPAAPVVEPTPVPPPPPPGARAWWKVGVGIALLLVFGAGAILIARHPSAPVPLRITPLTGFRGEVRSPSFSPDGERVAFTWQPDKAAGRHVYAKLVDAGEPLQLTNGGGVDDSPQWSPDGRSVAFVREDDAGRAIWVVPALGGAPQRVYGFNQRRIFHWLGQPMAWLSAGEWLVSDRELAGGGPEGPILPLRIYRMREGARLHPLTKPPGDWWGDVAPAVSPDGEWFAFLRGASFTMANLYVQRVNGSAGSERALLQGAVALSGVGWSPDSEFVYVGGELDQGSGIWRVPVQGGEPVQVTATLGLPQGLTVSRQKERAAFTDGHMRAELWTMPLPGDAASLRLLTAAGGHAQQPRISPDGRRIAFVSTRSGSAELWMANRDGSGLVQLTRTAANPGSPQWSPDGGRVAYSALVNNDAEIFVLDTVTGKPTRLTISPGLDSMPSWSADGRWVYFSSKRGGSMDVWKVPAGGGEAVRVTRQGGHQPLEWNGHLYFRPDMILAGLLRMPLSGGEPQMVWDGRFLDIWAGTGGIYLLLEDRIVVVGSVKPVASLAGAGAISFSLSPDEKEALLVRSVERSSDVMVVHHLQQ